MNNKLQNQIIKDAQSMMYRSKKFKTIFRSGNRNEIKNFIKENMPTYIKKISKSYTDAKNYIFTQDDESELYKILSELVMKSIKKI
jgi:L-lactate utilization protein LutB